MGWKDSLGGLVSSVAPVVGALTGGVGGAIAGIAGNYINNRVNASANASSLRRNASWAAGLSLAQTKQLEENLPSWRVKGMRDAGLNPLLAVDKLGGTAGASVAMPSMGGSGASSGSGNTMQNVMMGASAASAIAAAISDNDTKVETNKLALEQQKMKTELMESQVKAERTRAEVDYYKARAEKDIIQDIGGYTSSKNNKQVGVFLPSDDYKNYRKGFSDEWALRSEGYMRSTAKDLTDAGLSVVDRVKDVKSIKRNGKRRINRKGK